MPLAPSLFSALATDTGSLFARPAVTSVLLKFRVYLSFILALCSHSSLGRAYWPSRITAAPPFCPNLPNSSHRPLISAYNYRRRSGPVLPRGVFESRAGL